MLPTRACALQTTWNDENTLQGSEAAVSGERQRAFRRGNWHFDLLWFTRKWKK